MPDPTKYDDKGAWMSDCVSTRQDEHPDEDTEQSVAACLSMWSNKSAKTVIRKTHEHEIIGNEYILSDASVDRYGDIVDSNGWVLENFTKNPIALFNHNSDFPIGRWKNLGVRNGALRGHL